MMSPPAEHRSIEALVRCVSQLRLDGAGVDALAAELIALEWALAERDAQGQGGPLRSARSHLDSPAAPALATTIYLRELLGGREELDAVYQAVVAVFGHLAGESVTPSPETLAAWSVEPVAVAALAKGGTLGPAGLVPLLHLLLRPGNPTAPGKVAAFVAALDWLPSADPLAADELARGLLVTRARSASSWARSTAGTELLSRAERLLQLHAEQHLRQEVDGGDALDVSQDLKQVATGLRSAARRLFRPSAKRAGGAGPGRRPADDPHQDGTAPGELDLPSMLGLSGSHPVDLAAMDDAVARVGHGDVVYRVPLGNGPGSWWVLYTERAVVACLYKALGDLRASWAIPLRTSPGAVVRDDELHLDDGRHGLEFDRALHPDDRRLDDAVLSRWTALRPERGGSGPRSGRYSSMA